MMSFGFLNLKGIRGQITALVAISIVALHAIITATFLIYRAEQPEGESEAGPFQLATAIRILGRAPADDRPRPISFVPIPSSTSNLIPVRYRPTPDERPSQARKARRARADQASNPTTDLTADLPDPAAFAASAPATGSSCRHPDRARGVSSSHCPTVT